MHGKFDGLGRFTDPSLLIRTSLSDGPKHGYAIMTDITAFSGVRLEPGALYGALSRLERRGWIRPLAADERRRPFEITAVGQEVLVEQLRSMQQIVRVALQRAVTARARDEARPGRPARPAPWSAATRPARSGATRRNCSTCSTSTGRAADRPQPWPAAP